jgi:small subunit ribosomal protein S16
MAVKIRMMRMGRRHRPFFRINAVDARTPRGGRILEKLGHYDPIEKDPAKQLVINLERIKYWLGAGAVPTDSVSDILLRAGIKHKHAEQRKKRRTRARAQARAKGIPFTKSERIAAQKQAEEAVEKAKAEEKTKVEEKVEAKKPEAEGEKVD